MKAFVGVTDSAWAAYLSSRPWLDEVNFWLPTPRAFRALAPGDVFLFKTHHPANRVVGGGFFETYAELRVSEAWDFVGEGNGVGSAEQLLTAITAYRRDRGSLRDDPIIGAVMLGDVRWFGAQSLPGPRSFAKNIVRGKTYAPGNDAIVDLAVAQLVGTRLARADLAHPLDSPTVIGGPTHGSPTLVVPRLHQGAFRALVLDAYEAHCAITGHRIRPTLEAAHIRPVAAGGEHRVDNGMLLRSDIHTLFDRGYLTVDPSHRLRVSPRLKADFGNGDDLYALADRGDTIRLPRRQPDVPSRESLEWHADTVFLAS